MGSRGRTQKGFQQGKCSLMLSHVGMLEAVSGRIWVDSLIVNPGRMRKERLG